MQITAYGSAGEVTGSNFYLTTAAGVSFLIDFGLFQGTPAVEARNRLPLAFDPATLDFVIVTHAHIDHSGRLPMLTKQGFTGKIFMTFPTRDLVEALLLDSASIQKEEALPLYSAEDVHETLARIYPLAFDALHREGDIEFSLHQSGHLLGSAFVKLFIDSTTYTFSGDVGRYSNAYYPDPSPMGSTDVLITESTYGNSQHRNKNEAYSDLLEAVLARFAQGQTMIIPAFSVGRTSEILHELRRAARREGRETDYDRIPVYLDSPLGLKALDIYRRNSEFLAPEFDEELLTGSNIHLLAEAEASYALDRSTTPKIILTSGGMAQGGHITHHLVAFLPLRTTTIIMVGYQAEETVGRQLEEGAPWVRIGEREVKVEAEILTIRGFSGHGDQTDLSRWIDTGHPKSIYLAHGEPSVLEEWKAYLIGKGYSADILQSGETINVKDDR